MKLFFDSKSTKDSLLGYQRAIGHYPVEDEFTRDKFNYISAIFQTMMNHASEFDSLAKFNIEKNSTLFLSLLDGDKLNPNNTDLVFAIALRFYREYFFSKEKNEDNTLSDNLFFFTKENLEKFTPEAKMHIQYSFGEMHVDMLREVFSSEDFRIINKFPAMIAGLKETIDTWDASISEREEKVNTLMGTLSAQEHSINFVNLFNGFSDLANKKIKEKRNSFWSMIVLGVLTLTPIIIEAFLLHVSDDSQFNKNKLFTIIPAASLTLIMLYFFRISLANYTSIKAQILQIDLRKSLCRFVQSYSEFSSTITINDKNPLNKFEEVIFSNIMISEDKIPSTFDGIEQIATLISSLKGK